MLVLWETDALQSRPDGLSRLKHSAKVQRRIAQRTAHERNRRVRNADGVAEHAVALEVTGWK